MPMSPFQMSPDEVQQMSQQALGQSFPQMAKVDPHDSLTVPIGPPAPEPITMAPGGPKEAPSKMSLQPEEENINSRLMADYKKDQDPYGSPDNHPGFFGKLLHGLNVATGGVNRRGMEEQKLEGRAEGLSKLESEEGLQGAQASNQTASANKDIAETPEIAPNAAASREHEGAETANLQSEAAERNQNAEMGPSLIQGHAHAVNQAIKANRDPATDPLVQQYEDAITRLQKQPAAPKEVNPQQQTYDDLIKKGMSPEDALRQVETKPPQIHVDNGAHEFAEQERGRGLLDKAEASYRTAQQGANTMLDMVASARAGNKMSAQVLPLEGALAITTAQGVHRINRTEVEQYAGAGNLYDRIAGELGKVGQGQPIPPNILNDIVKLTQIQEKGAYGTYRGAYDSATKRYKLTDEQALPEPDRGAQGSGGGPIVQHSPSTGQYRYSTDGGKTWQMGQPKTQ